jgi:hypothetical protein
MAEEDRPFLLPLFFESVPGISRLVRQQRLLGAKAQRGPTRRKGGGAGRATLPRGSQP